MSKLAEKVMFEKIDNYMSGNCLCSKYTYVYQTKHCTMNAFTDLIEILSQYMDQNYQNMNVLLDLLLALDCVNPEILEKKFVI